MVGLSYFVARRVFPSPLLFVLATQACSNDAARRSPFDAGAAEATAADTGRSGRGLIDGSTPSRADADATDPIAPKVSDVGDAPDPVGSDARSDASGDGSDSRSDGSRFPDAVATSDAASGAPDDAATPDASPAFPPYPAVPYPAENPNTPAKAILGKILFWEEQLSSDDTVACGTCHRSVAGGSDPRASTSESRHPGPDAIRGTPDDIHGSLGIARCKIEGDGGTLTYIEDAVFGLDRQVTRRKAPTYLDAMFAQDTFWDGRATSAFVDPDTGLIAIAVGGALESQAVGPPLNDVEMACEGRTWQDIHAKLGSVVPLALASDIPADMAVALAGGKSYPDLFEEAFGTPEITTRRIAFALATHERQLTSDQTPWDRWNVGDQTAMTPEEVHGFEAFMGPGRCAPCHPPPLFTNLDFHNLGFIDASFDLGRQNVTGDPADRGRMKTPSLRNVGLREAGGLLHNGAIHGVSLNAVMAAYEFPPKADGNTDPQIFLLALTTAEKANMIMFMRNALTDPRVRDEVFPFDRPKLGSEP
jgi:cytochrome c peroxidase